jgi:hypothetical protein
MLDIGFRMPNSSERLTAKSLTAGRQANSFSILTEVFDLGSLPYAL